MNRDPQPRITSTGGPPSWIAPVMPVIPDHELVRRIGGGSYGDVWLARTTVGTWRAVKVVFRDRFTDVRPYEREFSGMLKFEPLSRGNEAFVDILQIGRNDAAGYFYYVMELADSANDEGRMTKVEGEAPVGSSSFVIRHSELGSVPPLDPVSYVPQTLSKVLLQRGRLPVRECVELGLTLNLGLAHLHRAGLIHRDIKPSNIIFVGGVPKLADIGLVIELAEARSYVGTEGFIPPEGPNSPQADLFSLGKVLYEAGMGKDRKDFPEPMTQIAEGPDAPVLLEFNAILLKACAANREERYRSAEEMNVDLALLQSGGSVRRQRKLAGQLRLVQRAGVVVTALAAVIALGWWWQARQTRTVRELATDKSRLAEVNREQLMRLRVANGVRQMDQGDAAASLASLAEALLLATNSPAEAAIQRIRINQILAGQPRLLHVLPHPASVQDAEFSADERRVVTGCADGSVRIWDLAHDEKAMAEFRLHEPVGQVRFLNDERQVLVMQFNPLNQPERVALIDVATGKPVFPPITNITCATLSPNRRWLAVARADFTIQLLATETGAVVASAAGHEGRVESIHFSPDSSQLLSASRDQTVRRWSIPTGRPVGPPLRHTQPVLRAVFNPDADRIATATFAGNADGPIQFQTWDAASGSALGNPIPGLGHDSLLAFDRSGRRLLTEDREAVARVWDADSHTALLPPLRTGGGGRSYDFSPDGAWLAIGSEAGSVRVWDLESGIPLFPQLNHAGRTEGVRFNRDGSCLLTASDDGTAKLWDLALTPADRSRRILSHERPSAAVSPDGRQMLLGTVDQPAALHLLDLETLSGSAGSTSLGPHSAPGGAIVFDRTGRQWATVFDPNAYIRFRPQPKDRPCTVGLWRQEQGRIQHFLLPHPTAVASVFFHQDGSQLLTAGQDRMTRIWNTANGSLRETIRRPEADAGWFAVSPDLSTAVALVDAGKSWHMAIRDVRTGKARGRPPEDNPDFNDAAFSPDGTRIATVGDNQCGRIWDARTGEPLTPYFKHGRTLHTVEWSPDGRRVLTAGLSPEVIVWDAASGQMALPPLVMKSLPVERARFSADGRFIVARSDEKLVRVWDAATGEAVTPWLPHPDHVAYAFVTAGQHLVTVQNDGTVRVRNLTAATLDAARLFAYARLLADGSLERSVSLRAPDAGALAAQLHALRPRQPDLFDVSVDRVNAWHRRLAEDPRTRSEAEAAIFHLEHLVRHAPADSTLREQLQRCRDLVIPARDPATPSRLLDLTRAYTHGLDLLPRREFAELPRGRKRLGDVEFDLRGMLQLDHHAERAEQIGPFHSAAAVQVRQRCRALHFLQATEGDPRVNGSVVARWIIHYADGSTREWPVVYGEHLRDWVWWAVEEPLEANQARVVWRGQSLFWNLASKDVRLFDARWTNPQPEVEITWLEYRIGETALKPFVVAITAE